MINVNGETVVDIWGGFRDEAMTVPWTKDTITNVWSSTKTVTNLAALMLADRGQLDVYAPIARYWPEYGANGKQDIEVRHLAAQAPWWEPGTASGYHAQNQGHMVGELVHRITGKSLKQFVADEMAGPLGADFQIGALEKDWDRIADVVPPPPRPFDMDAIDPESPAFKTFTGPAVDAAAANTPGWTVGSASGTDGVARSSSWTLIAG